MKPEEMKYSLSECHERLQAENQRADKAEEMVAGLVSAMKHAEGPKINSEGCCTECYVSISKPGDHLADCSSFGFEIENSESVRQAFRQKLCDEIVGKIEVSRKEVMEHTPCTDHIGFDNSIDIVKSVLIEEG